MSPLGCQKLKLLGSIILIPLGMRTMSIDFPIIGFSGYVPMVLILAGIYSLIVSILELARRMRQADAEPAVPAVPGTSPGWAEHYETIAIKETTKIKSDNPYDLT